jgi:hypothetical protein
MRKWTNVQVVDDAGHEALQVVVTVDEVVDMLKTGELEIGNPRPDHDLIPVGKKGVLKYRKTAQRVTDWADALLRNEAIFGNLTWNLQPGTEYEVVPLDGRTGSFALEVSSGGFATDVDSASRLRAIEMASKANPMTMDLSTRISARVFPVERGPATDKLFWFYNQVGEKVSNTVAKAIYQGNPHQRIAKELFEISPHLGLDNVETKSDVISKNSAKLCAFGTLAGAIEANWSAQPFSEKEEHEQAEFLARFWDALVHYVPDVGKVTLARRQALRGTSLVATALAIHGYIGVADRLYQAGSEDFSVLAALKGSITLPADGLRHKTGETVSWLDYDNPDWLTLGVLVSAVNKAGEPRRNIRMSFQTRKAMTEAMIERVRV